MNTLLKQGLTISILAASISAVHAGSYEVEAGIGYVDSNTEIGANDVDSDGFDLGGTFYFDSVDNSQGPLAEAAFIQHASDLSVRYVSTEEDIDNGDEDDAFRVSTRVVLPNSFIVTANYQNEETESTNVTGTTVTTSDTDLDSYGVGVGYYINDLTEGSFSYQTTEISETQDTDQYIFAGKTLLMDQAPMPISLDGAIGFVESDDLAQEGEVFSFGGTVYPQRQLGVGASLEFQTLDQSDVTQFTLSGEYFVTEQVVIGLSYITSSEEFDAAGQPDEDEDTLLFQGALRI